MNLDSSLCLWEGFWWETAWDRGDFSPDLILTLLQEEIPAPEGSTLTGGMFQTQFTRASNDDYCI